MLALICFSPSLKLLANGGMDASSVLESMEMRDVSESGSFVKGRPILPVYKQLLLVVYDPSDITPRAASVSGKGRKPPISLSLNKRVDPNGTSWTEIMLCVANFRLNIGSIFFRLPAFFIPPKTDEAAEIAAVMEDLSSASSSLDTSMMKVAAPVQKVVVRAPSYLTARIIVQNPIIQLVQDPTAEVSEALLLTFGLSSEVLFSDNTRHSVLSADFQLTDFQTFSTLLDSRKVGFVQLSDDTSVSGVILAPFSVNGKVRLTTPHDAVTALTILDPLEEPTQSLSLPTLNADVNIEPILVRISYKTYRLALRTLDALMHATNEEDQKKLEAMEKQALLDVERAAAIATESSLPAGDLPRVSLVEQRRARPGKCDGENGVVDGAMPLGAGLSNEELDVRAAPNAFNRLFNAENVRVQLRQAHVSLINDRYGFDVPIARFQIDGVNMELHGYAHHRALHAELSLSAEYYNQNLVVFEPMLEPYDLQLQLVQNFILSSTTFNRTLDANATAQQLQGGSASASSSAGSFSSSTSGSMDRMNDMNNFAHSGVMVSTQLTVSSPKALAFNVSQTMYRGLGELLKLFTVDQQTLHSDAAAGAAKAQRPLLRVVSGLQNTVAPSPSSATSSLIAVDTAVFFPFRFENYTEFPITVARQRAGDSGSRKPSSERLALETDVGPTLHLDPYTICSFDFPPSMHVTEYGLSVKVNREGAHPDVSFETALRSMQTQTWTLPVSGGDGKRTARMLFEVRVHEGVKVCRLRGVAGVRNSTVFPLEMRSADASSQQADHTWPILQPGQTLYLPVQGTDDSGDFRLQMRPHAASNSRSMITSEFAFGPPVLIKQTISRQHQFFSAIHTPSQGGSAVAVSACGDHSQPHSMSHLMGSSSNFTCSFSILHSWEHSDFVSVDTERQGLAGERNGKLFTAQIYEVGPAVLIQNLMAADLEVRLAEKKQQTQFVHWSAEVRTGDAHPVHLVMSKQQMYLQMRIPSLLTAWSDLLALPMAPAEGTSKAVYPLLVRDDPGRELQVHVEVHLSGTMRLTLYTPYWVYDYTDLGLILSADSESTVPLGHLKELKRKLATDVRSPVMFNFPPGWAGKKDVRLTTLFNVESAKTFPEIQWSEPISIDKPGLNISTTIPGALQKLPDEDVAWLRSLSDIGAEVTQSSDPKWHRTKQIKLNPHFVFINRLNVDLECTQRVSQNKELVHKVGNEREEEAESVVLRQLVSLTSYSLLPSWLIYSVRELFLRIS
jgi:hypothetical protein